MKVEQVLDVPAYLTAVESLLLKNEACNNLPLGILHRLNAQLENQRDSSHLGLIKDGGEVAYAFLQSKLHNLVLPQVESVREEFFSLLAAHLNYHEVSIPGVIGPPSYVHKFIREWKKLTGVEANVHMKQLIYRLDKVNDLDWTKGKLVKACPGEEKLLAGWLELFGIEVNEPLPKDRAKQMAASFIKAGSAYLWKVNGIPVSMVNQARRTKNGITINGVFTPNEYKQKGYATSAVAALSQSLLNEGSLFCSLYTDLDNPTSNSIYKKIGYYPIGKSVVYQFQHDLN